MKNDSNRIRVDTRHDRAIYHLIRIEGLEHTVVEKSIEWKTALIESILLGMPIGAILMDYSVGNCVVLDGKARVTTIKDFMDGKFKLTGLNILKEMEGLDYNTISRHIQRYMEEHIVTTYTIQPDTPEVFIPIMIKMMKGECG